MATYTKLYYSLSKQLSRARFARSLLLGELYQTKGRLVEGAPRVGDYNNIKHIRKLITIEDRKIALFTDKREHERQISVAYRHTYGENNPNG